MKEQVIVFEGEHLFVAPKKRISNKKKGVQIPIPEEMNVVAPVGVGVLPPPIEPPRQPDDPIGSPKTTTTQQEDASKPTPVPADVTLASKGTLAQNDAIALGGAGGGGGLPPMENIDIKLGDAIKVVSDEELTTTTSTTTSTTTQTTTKLPPIPDIALGTVPLVPLSLGAAPRLGGGGGGGEEEAPPVEEKKTNYLWLVLLGIAGLIYFTKKKP
jgi:hypothetical protein